VNVISKRIIPESEKNQFLGTLNTYALKEIGHINRDIKNRASRLFKPRKPCFFYSNWMLFLPA